MAEFELDAAGASEAQQKQAMAYLFPQGSTGVAASGVLTGLGVSATGTPSVSVQIGTGACVAQASALTGVSVLVNNSTKTLDVLTANPVGGLPRNDIVVFDPGTKTIDVIVGTPNAVPADPTVPAGAVALARLRHSAGATSIPGASIDDIRSYTGPSRLACSYYGYGTTGGSKVGTNVVVVSSVALPQLAFASRVFIQAEGAAGFDAAERLVGLSIGGSHAVVARAAQSVTAAAGKWAPVSISGYMDVPANTGSAVNIASVVDGAGQAYFRVGVTLTQVPA